ncbi:MAG TPA: DUF6188 family protein [Mycobacteriales bacterium]|jgi:hypothetical protein|nr:DUF6188 family protein [Mycobacteriales bacterium]
MSGTSEEFWLRTWLDGLAGLRLTECSIGVTGIRLPLSGVGGRAAEIVIERDTIQLTGPDQEPRWKGVRDELTAAALLGVIDDSLARIDIAGGHLTLAFSGGFRIDIPADDDTEAWSVRSADRALVVCRPGGELAFWSPPEGLNRP